MFVDEVEIEVKAGDGGSGAVAFRREKFVPRGGPSGGDGGHGGSVILRVDANLSTLLDFRYKRHYKAARGADGSSKDQFGRNGADLVLMVPPGSVATDVESGDVMADLAPPNTEATIARGGTGGRGNAHFATSVQQAPKFAEKGEPGEFRRVRLELKLLADVGLLGFPSVGKSTLIAAVSAARPKIAEYPFTTLVPNLGVVRVPPDRSFVMADLPGLIEGAHRGAGLGHRFLKHLERTRVLAHMLDVSGLSGRDPLQDYRALNEELRLFDERLAARPQVVALNKIDVAVDLQQVEALEAELVSLGCEVHRISAATRTGVEALLYALWRRLEAERAAPEPGPVDERVVIRAERAPDLRDYTVDRAEDGAWLVAGKMLERTVSMTDLENEDAVRRLQRVLERIGVNRKLRDRGAADGDTVRIGRAEFDYADEDVR